MMERPLFLFLVAVSGSIAKDFIPVLESCKYWAPLSIYFNGEKTHMHCILDQDNQLGLVNTTWILVPPGECPIFNRYTKNIDTKVCNAGREQCPEKEVCSYESVQYDGCIHGKKQIMNQRQEIATRERPNTRMNNEESEPCTCGSCHITVAVLTTILIAMIAMIVAVVILGKKYIFQGAALQPNHASNQERGNGGNENQHLKSKDIGRHAVKTFEILLNGQINQHNISTTDQGVGPVELSPFSSTPLNQRNPVVPEMPVVQNTAVPTTYFEDDLVSRGMDQVRSYNNNENDLEPNENKNEEETTLLNKMHK